MTTAAIRSPRIRTVGRLGCWPSVRHSLRVQAAGALTLYGLYELTRGLVVAHVALPTTFEIFGSVVAAIALTVAVEAWRTRPTRPLAA